MDTAAQAARTAADAKAHAERTAADTVAQTARAAADTAFVTAFVEQVQLATISLEDRATKVEAAEIEVAKQHRLVAEAQAALAAAETQAADKHKSTLN